MHEDDDVDMLSMDEDMFLDEPYGYSKVLVGDIWDDWDYSEEWDESC